MLGAASPTYRALGGQPALTLTLQWLNLFHEYLKKGLNKVNYVAK